MVSADNKACLSDFSAGIGEVCVLLAVDILVYLLQDMWCSTHHVGLRVHRVNTCRPDNHKYNFLKYKTRDKQYLTIIQITCSYVCHMVSMANGMVFIQYFSTFFKGTQSASHVLLLYTKAHTHSHTNVAMAGIKVKWLAQRLVGMQPKPWIELLTSQLVNNCFTTWATAAQMCQMVYSKKKLSGRSL